MQEEIKKILDRLERIDHKEYIAFEFADSATFDEVARCFEERKKMADYITNLQENYERIYNENCKLREEHNITDISLLDENNRLKEENERLKEKIDILKSNFEVEIDDCEDYKKWYRDYKSRNKKAIEYIDIFKNDIRGLDDIVLLNILNGDDINE